MIVSAREPCSYNRLLEEDVSACLPPKKLFHYSHVYQVLICTACRYAIQPGAITRHLKEIHRMSLHQRRPYTLYTSNLKLKKPEEVIAPLHQDFPLPYLPLEEGWCCKAPGCNYLCVSIKRMESHWPAKHGCKGGPGHGWSSAPLQTFFRGNMLRYFTGQAVRNLMSGLTSSADQSSNSGPSEFANSAASPYVLKLREKYGLDPIDSLMLEHYFLSSYKTLLDKNTEKVWLGAMANLAEEHVFLLHGILACTALHMAHLYPMQSQAYIVRACVHQESALPLFRHAIEHPTEHNCDAIVIFAHLLVVYSFASDLENSNSSLLLVENTGAGHRQNLVLPQWLHFFRTGCVMLMSVWDRTESGPVSLLAEAYETDLEIATGNLPYLDHFLSIIPQDKSWSDQSIVIYRHAAIALAKAFAYLEHTKDDLHVSTWNILGLWPVRVEDEFFELLSLTHPGALILLAYYCVILKHMEECWYFGGRPAKLIFSIAAALPLRWHPFIQEAVSRVANPI